MAREGLTITDMAEDVGVTFTSMRTFLGGSSVLREAVLETLVAVLRDAGLLAGTILPGDFDTQVGQIAKDVSSQGRTPRTAAAQQILTMKRK